jgi:alpha-tubulin suppressor-like RCC1 family protein
MDNISDANPSLTGGELWTCGRATEGGLGVGNTTYYSSPVQVGSQTDWTTGVALFNACVMCKSTGKLYSWGSGDNGKNGRGDTTDVSSPIQVGSLTDWLHLGGGEQQWHAIKTDGTLWGCGRNTVGVLGDGTTTARSSPVQIGSDTDWVRVAGGGATHAGAIRADGSLWTWGANNYGKLGLGSGAGNKSVPTQVGALKDWNWVNVGFASTVAVKQDGTLWWWGRGVEGDSPLGNTTTYSSPVQVGSLTDWRYPFIWGTTSVLNGGGCIKTDGTAWTWGDNTNGWCGDGSTTTPNSPVQVGALTTWATGFSGFRDVLFLTKTDGTLWSHGTNTGGMQMHGDLAKRSSPVQVGSLTTWNANHHLFGCNGTAHSWAIK